MSDQLRRRHRRRQRRRTLAVVAGLALAAAAVVGGALAWFRYLPAYREAQALKTDVETLISRAKSAGLGLERPELLELQAGLTAAAARFDNLDALMRRDPVISVARALPPSHAAVESADALMAAGRDLLAAARSASALGDRYVAIKEHGASAGAESALADLVELMATGRAEVDRLVAGLDGAEAALATVPDGPGGPLVQMRDTLASKLREYGPALREYARLDDILPSVLGWDGPRRYLVLAQDPAELRPTGGLVGSYGILAFDRGRITERSFEDVAALDTPWDFPFVDPPAPLKRYLLGDDQPWQLADANWSPDFPTSARQAVALYRNEGGQGRIDGVVGITTQTIDTLLETTGPVTVPEYGVTIASGETTLKVLQNTRVARSQGESRKAFLGAFADQLFGSLFRLPPSRWIELAGQAAAIQGGHELQAWMADAAAEAAITSLGLDGRVRQDAGDYLYPVDANVSPVSKLNAVTDRSMAVTVRLDALGTASDAIDVAWENTIEASESAAYRALPRLEDLRTLGMYFRLLVPADSRVTRVAAGTTVPLGAPSDVTAEAGRMVIANYFRIPPGTAHLRYEWTSPYAADLGEDGVFTYRLTIQKQPGARPGPLELSIELPMGAIVIDASPGLTLRGGTLAVETTLDRDIVAVVRYRLPGEVR